MTKRKIAGIIQDFRQLTPASQIAKAHNISSSTAFRCFDLVHYGRCTMPEVLSLDEFKGNAGGEKYQCILTDPQHRKVLDILPSRKEQTLLEYFKQCKNRENVKYVVMDMNPHFREIARICFPRAKIVADKYHVVRQVGWAMENVRKEVQKQFSKSHRLYFKHSKMLLMKRQSELSEAQMLRLCLMLELSPELANAYRLYQRFLLVMHAEDSDKGRILLKNWILDAEFNHIPAFHNALTAVHNWSTEILNSLDVPYTNGYTEGCNNKTKVLKRVSFGVRNFSRFRNRILFCSAV